MVKTPNSKARKSVKTPKTLPKRLTGTPNTDAKLTPSKRQPAVRWPKLDFEADASTALSICTPGRTTRSMARVVSNDFTQQLLVFTSKREKVSSAKKSKKMSLAVNDNAEQSSDTDGTFARPRSKITKGKRVRKSQLNSSNVVPSESDDDQQEGGKAEHNDNDDAPEQTTGKFVRAPLKSLRKQIATDVLSEDDAPLPDIVESSEDDLPSVSILGGTSNTSGRYVRVSRSMQSNTEECSSNDEGLPSVSMLGAVKTRKSQRTEMYTALSSGDDLASPDVAIIEPTPTEQNGKSRKSKRSIVNQVESSEDDLPSVSILGGTPNTSSRSSLSFQAKKDDSNSNDEHSGANKQLESNQNAQSSAVQPVDNEQMDIKQEKQEQPAEKNQFPQKVLNKKQFNRVSVIDLTDSPMPANKSVLNRTFTPEKSSNDVKDQTFTEEEANATSVNDKTFSPVQESVKVSSPVTQPGPSRSQIKDTKNAKDQLKTPITKALRSTIKSTGKSTGKSGQVKRLQGTHIGNTSTRNNLMNATKLTSAKKTKMLEAAIELAVPSKTKSSNALQVPTIAPPPVFKFSSNTLQVPAMDIASPPVFKFGERTGTNLPFRFSLVSDHLFNNPSKSVPVPQSNCSSAVKPVPNFGNIHNRMFKKAESIEETRSRHNLRAKQLLSGKKPNQAPKNDPKPNDSKPVNKRAKVGLDFGSKTEERPERLERRPLSHVNRARLNDEQRQEKRMQQFKQTKRQSTGKKTNMTNIKGVRLNRRFELMMQNRKIEKCGSNHGSNQASN